MTPTDSANAYLQTKVLSARPEELRLMLLDGALKFLHQARRGIEQNDHEQAFDGFTQCRAIILELMTTIDHEAAGPVGEQVKGVLSFMYTELVEARRERDIAKVDKVIGLLEYERETWVLAMEHLAQELRGTPAGPAVQSAAHPAPATPATPATPPQSGGFSISA